MTLPFVPGGPEPRTNGLSNFIPLTVIDGSTDTSPPRSDGETAWLTRPASGLQTFFGDACSGPAKPPQGRACPGHMLRALAVLLACHGVAAAHFGAQLEGSLDGAVVLGPPDDIPVWLTPADRERREIMYLGAFPETLHPLAKANLWLALGDLDVAKAVTNKRATAELLDQRDIAGANRIEAELPTALYSADCNYI